MNAKNFLFCVFEFIGEACTAHAERKVKSRVQKVFREADGTHKQAEKSVESDCRSVRAAPEGCRGRGGTRSVPFPCLYLTTHTKKSLEVTRKPLEDVGENVCLNQNKNIAIHTLPTRW